MFTKQFTVFCWKFYSIYILCAADKRFHLHSSNTHTHTPINRNAHSVNHQTRKFQYFFMWTRREKKLMYALTSNDFWILKCYWMDFDGCCWWFGLVWIICLFVRSLGVFFFCCCLFTTIILPQKYKSKEWWKQKKITKTTRTLLHTTTTAMGFCSSQVDSLSFSVRRFLFEEKKMRMAWIYLLFILTLICSKFQL